jgi:hypothetical protein
MGTTSYQKKTVSIKLAFIKVLSIHMFVASCYESMDFVQCIGMEFDLKVS